MKSFCCSANVSGCNFIWRKTLDAYTSALVTVATPVTTSALMSMPVASMKDGVSVMVQPGDNKFASGTPDEDEGKSSVSQGSEELVVTDAKGGTDETALGTTSGDEKFQRRIVGRRKRSKERARRKRRRSTYETWRRRCFVLCRPSSETQLSQCYS